MVIELKPILKIPTIELAIKCILFEDNKVAEELANTLKNRQRTHIPVKYYNFREAARKNILHVKHVDTKDQLADIFTKPLTISPLDYHMKILILKRTMSTEKIHRVLNK